MDGLKNIYFGEHFNQPLDYLPNTIKTIVIPISGHFNQSLDNLPEQLETLFLNRSYSNKLFNLPVYLKKLCIHKNYPYLEELKNNKRMKDVLMVYDI